MRLVELKRVKLFIHCIFDFFFVGRHGGRRVSASVTLSRKLCQNGSLRGKGWRAPSQPMCPLEQRRDSQRFPTQADPGYVCIWARRGGCAMWNSNAMFHVVAPQKRNEFKLFGYDRGDPKESWLFLPFLPPSLPPPVPTAWVNVGTHLMHSLLWRENGLWPSWGQMVDGTQRILDFFHCFFQPCSWLCYANFFQGTIWFLPRSNCIILSNQSQPSNQEPNGRACLTANAWPSK